MRFSKAGTRWIAYGAIWLVLLVVFAANVQRSSFITDDAFISFRYSKHLVEGLGLVYNPGERVEGYTNFLWVLLIAAGMSCGFPPEGTANVLGILGGLGAMAGAAALAAKITRSRAPFFFAPALLLALNPSFTAWCTGGLETSFFAALVIAAILTFLHERGTRRRVLLPSAVLFAAAALTRPEGLLFAAIAGAFLGADVLSGRRPPVTLLAWSVPIAILVGGHLLWRHSYYGSWLPNSFHAKVNGTWFTQGARYFELFQEIHQLGWFLLLTPLALAAKDRRAAALTLTCVGAFCVYLLTIGGDVLEFRLLTIILPLVYALMVGGLAAAWRHVGVWGGRRWLGRTITVGVFFALVATTHASSRRQERIPYRYGIHSLMMIKGNTQSRIWQGEFLREQIERGGLPPDLVFATGCAGAVPYYTGWRTVDIRGLCDPAIARQPLEQRGLIAHEHLASLDYLRQRGVEMYDRRIRFVRRLPRVLSEVEEETTRHLYREIKLDGFYVGFVTFLDEEEFARRFGGRPGSR